MRDRKKLKMRAATAGALAVIAILGGRAAMAGNLPRVGFDKTLEPTSETLKLSSAFGLRGEETKWDVERAERFQLAGADAQERAVTRRRTYTGGKA